MTAREAKALKGQTGKLQLGTLTVEVKIVDTRENFGRIDLLVTPVSGSGQQWAQAVNVKVQKGGGK